MTEFKPKPIFTGVSTARQEDEDYRDIVEVIKESQAVRLGGSYLDNINVKTITVSFPNKYFISFRVCSIVNILPSAARCRQYKVDINRSMSCKLYLKTVLLITAFVLFSLRHPEGTDSSHPDAQLEHQHGTV